MSSSPPASQTPQISPVPPLEQTTSSNNGNIVFRGPFGCKLEDGGQGGGGSFQAHPVATRPDSSRRKSSVQFNVAGAEQAIRRKSVANPRRLANTSRRMSSPPPKSTYRKSVSFDTFDNKDATDFSLTLQYKHKDYQNTRTSRTWLCGTDQNDYSEYALEWLIEELVDDGDSIVCLRVVEKDSRLASDSSVEQGRYRAEAQSLLDDVIAKNSRDEKAISLVMELAVGRVEKVIQRMILIHEPVSLVVGTRGRSGMQSLVSGSVSKYCLQYSPVPVVVVRPSAKRDKKKKRRADLGRSNYDTILEQTQALSEVSNSVIGPLPDATAQEADAVAKAIGVTKNARGEIGRLVKRRRSPVLNFEELPSKRQLSPGPAELARSPMLKALDETWDSDSESSVEQSPRERSDSSPGPNRRASSHSEDPPWLKAILEKKR